MTQQQQIEVPRGMIDNWRWTPKIKLMKYDDDMVAFARARSGVEEPDGDTLARLCKPFDVVEVEDNLLLTAGLTRITSLITGAGGVALTNTTARLGVGNSSTAEAVGQTDLQAVAGAANRQFVIMDATYPTSAAGVITTQSTFTSGLANFVWAEWGIDIGTAVVVNGTTVNAPLVNRKVTALGTKATGSWVLQATITFS